MKTTAACFLISLLLLLPHCQADSFGSGVDQFDIEFVLIDNPNNLDDTTGAPNPAGNVEYSYRIGKYEISEEMIDKANFLGGLALTHDNRGANKPATSLSWTEAAFFVNWLNTSTGHSPAYKHDGSNFVLWQFGDVGYNPANKLRNKRAKYFLPSTDEWYKAAYYDPNLNIYYDYPTGSNDVPDGIDFMGDTTFDAVFYDGSLDFFPNDITDVGKLSPNGTAGQGGNVWEIEEPTPDSFFHSPLSTTGVRGGDWGGPSSLLLSSFYGGVDLFNELPWYGFRVASAVNIPEPQSLSIVLMLVAGSAARRKR